MGRVRKYKKIKAIDPFSNKKRSGIDVKHDDPPDLFDDKKRRNRKKLDRPFDDLDHAEKMLQREAVRQLRDIQSQNLHHKEGQKVVEGKRTNESMKDFQQRIKNETKITLREELLKMTKTSQKKKEHMKAKKMKKKLHKQATNGQGLIGGRTEEENDVINRDFNQRHDGLLRPSDLGAPSFFPKTDVVLFGERVEKPPDLKMLGNQLKKRKDRPSALCASLLPPTEEEVGNMDGSDDDDDDDAGGNKRIKRCKANRLDLDALEGDHDMQVGTTRRGLDQGIIYSGGLGNSTVQRKGKGNGVGKGKKDSQGGSKGMGDQSQHHRNVSSSSSSSSSATTSTSAAAAATAAEMEGLRTRVQEAYKLLREKRIKDAHATNNTSSTQKNRNTDASSHGRSKGGSQGKGGKGKNTGGFVMMSDLY